MRRYCYITLWNLLSAGGGWFITCVTQYSAASSTPLSLSAMVVTAGGGANVEACEYDDPDQTLDEELPRCQHKKVIKHIDRVVFY